MYTLYFTQTYKIKFKIVTILESLKSINILINTLKIGNFNIWKTLYAMINKLYENQAFKITTLLGIRSIILNRYSLPVDNKTDIFNEYSNLLLSKKKLNEKRKEDNSYLDFIRKEGGAYNKMKNNIISDIKSLFEENNQENNLNLMRDNIYSDNDDYNDDNTIFISKKKNSNQDLKINSNLLSKDYYCTNISKERNFIQNSIPNYKLNYKSYLDANNSVNAIRGELSNCEEAIEILSSKKVYSSKNLNVETIYTKEDLHKDSVTKLDLNINQYDYRYDFED